SALPCVTTATRRTALADGVVDPALDVIGEPRGRIVDDMEERLPVPLRSREPRVYDADHLSTPRRGRFGHPSDRRPTHLRITYDAFRDILPACFELRLDEHDRLPTRPRERKHCGEDGAHGDERHV